MDHSRRVERSKRQAVRSGCTERCLRYVMQLQVRGECEQDTAEEFVAGT